MKKEVLTDLQILTKYHKFLRQENEPDFNTAKMTKDDYGNLLAKKYYDKLFKEFAIIDLSNYSEKSKNPQISMRWRTENEVLSGKAEGSCANKGCDRHLDLTTYELTFQYKEDGQTKQALVKVRVCKQCGEKLNYKVKDIEIETTPSG